MTLTPTFTPSNTPTFAPTPTATDVPPASGEITVQVNGSSDDVNEVNGSLTTNGGTIWFGNGGSDTTSYLGLRFNNIAVPRVLPYTSAELEFYSSQGQWIGLQLEIAGEAADNAATFSTGALPSARSLTGARITHQSDNNWNANTWYRFYRMLPAVDREIVNRGWLAVQQQSGSHCAGDRDGNLGTKVRLCL